MNRQESTQPPPPEELQGFPTTMLGPDDEVYRCHRASNGPWWFSSTANGRFDLPLPRGTCYIAFTADAAVREVCGPELLAAGYLTTAFTSGRILSTLRVPVNHALADLTAPAAAGYRVTRELSTMTPYAIPQQWAAALDAHTDGIRYPTRFSTAPAAVGAALFGDAGTPDWRIDPAPISLSVAARSAGIEVIPPPSAVTIVTPPGAG